MDNEKQKKLMTGQILDYLRGTDQIVSGTFLSRELGVSRVAVWKHIQKLQKLAYRIVATPKGYKLVETPDFLFPWEFGHRASKIHYFKEVDSTMNVAREMARKMAPHLTLVITETQEKGRGRLNRTWISKGGGLYFTMITRPKIPVILSSRLNFYTSLTLVKTLRRRFSINAMVKWPNDVLVDGKKLAGMLSEMEAEGDMVSFINIGIGLNVNNDPVQNESMATSLKELIKEPVSRKSVLIEFLDDFEKDLDEAFSENIIPQWKKYSATLNRRVKVLTNRETFKGVAVDVDENGALLLKNHKGDLVKIIYGDCFPA